MLLFGVVLLDFVSIRLRLELWMNHSKNDELVYGQNVCTILPLYYSIRFTLFDTCAACDDLKDT